MKIKITLTPHSYLEDEDPQVETYVWDTATSPTMAVHTYNDPESDGVDVTLEVLGD